MNTTYIDPTLIDPSWRSVLENEFQQSYFKEIQSKLIDDTHAGKIIYPKRELVFNAFNITPFDLVKVVIIGQDPYHQPDQAMGLSFSVPNGIKIPPSLRNIYKELSNSVNNFTPPSHGNLTLWATQGVLMLNASLTVEAGKAGSHTKIGWQYFTDSVIRTLSTHKTGLIFLLWGNFAKQKASLIDGSKHNILTAAHPSPLAGNKFQGCNHFKLTNQILSKQNHPPINWQV